MWSVCVQHDRAGLFQVPLAALQKLLTLSSGPQSQPEELLRLQMVYGLRDAPVVSLQSCLTLLQCDTMHRSLNLCDALVLLHAGSCRSPIVVVVGGIWLGSTGLLLLLLHYGFDGCHVGCSISFQKCRSLRQRGGSRALRAVDQRGQATPLPVWERI